MPIDARIALAGIQPDFDGVGAFNTSRAAAQTYRTNQMAMDRSAAARAALANFMRPPAVQPGSAGPPITGAPLPAANAMGPAPVAAAPPARPVNAMTRDISELLPYADDPLIKEYIAQHNREATAAASAAQNAVTNSRQTAEEIRAATNFAEGYIAQASSRIAENADPATVTRELAWLRSIPGMDPAIVSNLEARVANMPPEELAGYARNYALQYAGSRAGVTDADPDMTQENTGSELGYRNMNPRSPGYGQTAFTRPATLSPAGQAADTRADEENAREDARDLQRQWDDYDERVRAHERWVAEADGPREATARAQVPRPRPPAVPRPGSNAPVAPPAAPPANRGSPPPAPPAGTRPGTTQNNVRTGATWTWDGRQWQ